MKKFIAIEGLDGAGKSTQIKKLLEYFKNKSDKIQFVHFPRAGKGIYGELVSKYLRGEYGDLKTMHPQIVALLFAGDRKDYAPNILKWLNQDNTVLVDRYVYSNIAFQCAKLDVNENSDVLTSWILKFEYEFNKIPKPDISIFLDMPLSFVNKSLTNKRIGIDRAYLNGKDDIHEADINFQIRVKEIYENLIIKNNDFIKIKCYNQDAQVLSPEEIHQKILYHIN